jgi:hypothetical protein
MDDRYEVSAAARSYIAHIEEIIGMPVHVQRQPDVSHRGVILDRYVQGAERNVIVFSNQQLGLLKDFVITQNAVRLAIRGVAFNREEFRVLSFGRESAAIGMEQVYLDILKDERTRSMDLETKKKMMFYIYLLFHETMSDIPWDIIANIVVAKRCGMMRTAQVYYLLKESMRDMHDLVSIKESIPNRYFVMHNAMFYARDLLLADVVAEYKLNPIINIPELKKFKNLSMTEMMTHRWQKSPWYHTKLVGDYLYQALKSQKTIEQCVGNTEADYYRMYQLGRTITDRWITLMHLGPYYHWESSEHLRDALKTQEAIEISGREKIFGEA